MLHMHPGAVALAESIMRLAKGLQDDVDQDGENWRKVYGGLRLIQHASASLLDYVDEHCKDKKTA